jgi:hypothetical protein
MSVKVNLLPPEIVARRHTRRVAAGTCAGVLAFIGVLGVVLSMKITQVEHARQDRDLAQAEVARLDARLAELQPYRELADALERDNALLAFAMEREISWAQILSDLSLTFPADSSLRTLTATVTEPTLQATGKETIASVQFNGYSTQEYAPGIETVLIEFDKVRSFFDTFLTTAAREEIADEEVTAFDSSVRITDDAYTRRYAEGLPGEVAQ